MSNRGYSALNAEQNVRIDSKDQYGENFCDYTTIIQLNIKYTEISAIYTSFLTSK